MKTEKFIKTSTIIVGIVLVLTFLINSVFKSLFGQTISLNEFFSLVHSIAILICLTVITRRYFNIQNALKVFFVMLAFWVLDTIIPIELSSVVGSFIYQIIRSWFATFVIILLFLWISKCRITKDKTLFTLIGISYGVSVILNISEYLSLMQYTSGLTVNSFFGYLALLDGSNSINSFLCELCFYAQILLVFLLLIKSLSLYGKEPKKKNDEISEEDDTDSLTAVEVETWKCMGCGQLVSVEKDRCSCGYKK